MSKAVALENLFDEGTRKVIQEGTVPLTKSFLPDKHEIATKLDALLKFEFSALVESALLLEKLKVNAHQVDGRIIGTGEEDFTKGNTLYTLNYKGKAFQLIDVPGIEGDESKYAHMVHEAVAKAHLVFYINGTNKKPEKATAEKIRSYLRRGTQVCPVVNVRGNADAYEFTEDRESLESHRGSATALKQTVGVLESALGREVLLPGYCIQGLLAFSSLAINYDSGKTSIHSSRTSDLVTHQRNYLKHFASAKAMFEFSQIRAIAQVLHAKLGTFRADIIESNKVKVRELLIENINILKGALKEHQTFMVRVEPEFEKCRESIEGSLLTFERLVAAGRKNLWNKSFNRLNGQANKIVADNFGNNDIITKKIKQAFDACRDDIRKHLQDQFDDHLKTLQSSLNQAMDRLIQDVRRIEFQQLITFDDGSQKPVYNPGALDMELGLKGWGSIAFNVGSFALAGAGLGSAIPVIGTAIGAIAGVVVGVLISVMRLFASKEERIRKAQAQIYKKIYEVHKEVMGRLSSDMKSLMKNVRKEVKDSMLSKIDETYSDLARPLVIIQQQLALMMNIKMQLEKMPHGAIQAIQR